MFLYDGMNYLLFTKVGLIDTSIESVSACKKLTIYFTSLSFSFKGVEASVCVSTFNPNPTPPLYYKTLPFPLPKETKATGFFVR